MRPQNQQSRTESHDLSPLAAVDGCLKREPPEEALESMPPGCEVRADSQHRLDKYQVARIARHARGQERKGRRVIRMALCDQAAGLLKTGSSIRWAWFRVVLPLVVLGSRIVSSREEPVSLVMCAMWLASAARSGHGVQISGAG